MPKVAISSPAESRQKWPVKGWSLRWPPPPMSDAEPKARLGKDYRGNALT
jgi:hypothetical protein